MYLIGLNTYVSSTLIPPFILLSLTSFTFTPNFFNISFSSLIFLIFLSSKVKTIDNTFSKSQSILLVDTISLIILIPSICELKYNLDIFLLNNLFNLL